MFGYKSFCQEIDSDFIKEIKLANNEDHICTNKEETFSFELSFLLDGTHPLFDKIEGGNLSYRIILSNKEGVFSNDNPHVLQLQCSSASNCILQSGKSEYTVPVQFDKDKKQQLFGEGYIFRIEVLEKGRVVSRTDSKEGKIGYGIYYFDIGTTQMRLRVKDTLVNVKSCEKEKEIELVLKFYITENGKEIEKIDIEKYKKNIVWYSRKEGGDNVIIDSSKTKLKVKVEDDTIEYYATLDTRCGKGGQAYRHSNSVSVEYEKIPDVSIEGGVVEICEGGELPELKVKQEDKNNIKGYYYQWLKFNGDKFVEIEGAKGSKYIPKSKGVYKVRLKSESSSSCFSDSKNNFEIKEVKNKGFELKVNVPPTVVLLPGETKRIEAMYSLKSSDICWYSKTDSSFKVCEKFADITKPGVYYAKVKDKSLSCGITKETEEITVLLAKSISLNIKANTYTECESSNTELQIDNLKAIATDDNTYDLSEDQLQQFTYQWYKNEKQVKQAVGLKYSVSSYKENGTYYLETVFKGSDKFKAQSNKIDVKLTAEKPNVQSNSKTNTICEGSSIIFSFTNVVEGFTYKWYKDDKPLTTKDPKKVVIKEIGVYKLEVEGSGCNSSQIIEVKPFDENAIKTTPKDKLILYPNLKGKIVAEGGDTYEWYNENDELVSSTETLETDKEGIYTLKVKSGICEAIKKIEVVVDEGGTVIQTIVSPNNDGINDTWLIPNKYAYQPNVLVNIYNANGKLIYTTKAYKNDWPLESVNNQKIFYYQIISDNKLIKAGAISVID